ncbi:substrate-binding periplasmic protein [Marinobacter sp.]|uniref:substrate-binding periplasmic protein n=1 Tax=Marinobacter sp. TaxID=50741 RepID=UPI0038508C50
MAGQHYPACMLILVLALFSAAPSAAEEPLKLLTGIWPPFIYPEGDGQGLVTGTVQEAFNHVGISTTVTVMPWNRVRHLVNTEGAISYGWSWSPELSTPWYYSEELVRTLDLFAERRSDPVEWSSIDDLRSRRIGVVNGYNLPVEIEQMKDQLTTITAPNDESNLRMLLAGRTDVAIINPRVARYLLERKFSEEERERVILQTGQPIDSYTLHLVCHKQTPDCADTILKFNEGMRRLKFDGGFGPRTKAK